MSTDQPKKKDRRGASAERMREITALRMEMAKTDPSKKGGRPRTRFTRQEATEAALTRLEPEAIRVLEAQLHDVDKRIAQTAAKLLLEWKRGKPTQAIKTFGENVTKIVYESAAWNPQAEREAIDAAPEDVEELPPELPPAA